MKFIETINQAINNYKEITDVAAETLFTEVEIEAAVDIPVCGQFQQSVAFK